MSAKPDFWGDVGVIGGVTPLAILREQAALLGRKTQDLVEAKVETHASEGGYLYHSFRLVVPALDDYTYELFSIHHSPAEMYPVRLARGTPLETEEEFKDWLSRTLSSPETKKILGNLLAQARS